MQRRLLTFGYKIDSLDNFDGITFSNYSLSFSSTNRWKKKLSNIEKMISNNELQCILFVITKNLISETLSLEKKDFIDLLNTCNKTNCIVAIQDYLLNDIPLYFDYNQGKYICSEDIKTLIFDLQNEGNNHALRKKLLSERVPDIITEDENGDTIHKDLFDSEFLVNKYKEKLYLLEETESIFPQAKELIKLLESIFEEIITFQHFGQVTVLIKDELQELFSNEILNIYIPKQYGYTAEFEDFIRLFERYLKSVENLNFSIEINETQEGINYKFVSIGKIENIKDLPNKFKRFSNFIDICEKQPDQAMELLENHNISRENALNIIQRLSKKYKRLILDIQQQKERLELTFKQELQSELFEYDYLDTPFSLIERNFSSKSFEEIYNPTEDERQIIRLFEKHAPDQEINQIKSNLGLVKDPDIPYEDKKRSGYKIKKTLIKILKKGIEHAEQIAIEAGIKYINSKL